MKYAVGVKHERTSTEADELRWRGSARHRSAVGCTAAAHQGEDPVVLPAKMGVCSGSGDGEEELQQAMEWVRFKMVLLEGNLLMDRPSRGRCGLGEEKID